MAGVEPALPQRETDFKSVVSTNSTTPAFLPKPNNIFFFGLFWQDVIIFSFALLHYLKIVYNISRRASEVCPLSEPTSSQFRERVFYNDCSHTFQSLYRPLCFGFPSKIFFRFQDSGTPSWTRTSNPLLRRQMLYPFELSR